MQSRKRTASQADLSTRKYKQARMSDSEEDLMYAAHAHGLSGRWWELLKETLEYISRFGGNTRSLCMAADTHAQAQQPSEYSQPSLISVSSASLHSSSTPTGHSLLEDTPAGSESMPPHIYSLSNTEKTNSESSTSRAYQTSSRVPYLNPYDRLQNAVFQSKIQYPYTNGVRGNYKRKAHIYAKQHSERVDEELERSLYEFMQSKGYGSDRETFRGWLAYKKRLEDLENRESSISTLYTQSKEPVGRQIIRQSDHVHFKRHMEKVRKTFQSPKPPKPFTPSMEQLKLSTRAKDELIDRRLHPKRPSLPKELPDYAQLEVQTLLSKKGVISKAGKEQVSDQDLYRLLPNNWLNDEIMNFYGQLITDRSVESEASKENGRKYLNVHYFSTFFWTKLHDVGYEKARLAKWTKKLDIFAKDIVLIPVNHSNSHWTAAAINFRQKRIESYDSMGINRNDVYLSLRLYLDEEHKNKKKKPFNFQGWEDYFAEDVPQQENGYDCGVFTCQFLETLSRGEEEFKFSQRDMPYLRQRMMWEIGRARLHDEG